jgi:hypothetical protein
VRDCVLVLCGCGSNGVGVGGRRTGPSPKSFSGFWKDMLSVAGLEGIEVFVVVFVLCRVSVGANQDLNS